MSCNPSEWMLIMFATSFLIITAGCARTNLWYAKRDSRKSDPDQIKSAQIIWYSALVAFVAQTLAILVTIISNLIEKY